MHKTARSVEAVSEELPNAPERAAPGARLTKQQQIVATARDIFFSKGFSATSMEAVAKAAGVGKATLYEFFPNKVELLRAIISVELDSRSENFTLAAASVGEMRLNLVKFGHSLIDLLLSPANIAIYRIISAETPRHPEFGRLFYQNGPARVIGHLARYFADLMEEGRLHYGNPTLLASQFIGIVRADMQTRSMLGVDDEALQRERSMVIESGVDAFMRAYAKTRAP